MTLRQRGKRSAALNRRELSICGSAPAHPRQFRERQVYLVMMLCMNFLAWAKVPKNFTHGVARCGFRCSCTDLLRRIRVREESLLPWQRHGETERRESRFVARVPVRIWFAWKKFAGKGAFQERCEQRCLPVVRARTNPLSRRRALHHACCSYISAT